MNFLDDGTGGLTVRVDEGGQVHRRIDDAAGERWVIDALLPTEVVIKVENAYEDGHESAFYYVLTGPESTDEDVVLRWFEDEAWEFTGDGHGVSGIGSCYTVTIIKTGGDEKLVGMNHEWID